MLVIAVGGNVGQGILKALALSSIPCRVIGADIHPLKLGLYTADHALLAPWANQPDFLPWLIDACRRFRVDAVLSGAEPVIEVLAAHADQIRAETGAVCVASPPAIFALGNDKLQTGRWLESLGGDFPRYAAAEDREAVRRLVRDHGFPLVAKPRTGGGSRGLLMVENERDLEYACHKANYLIQEYLPGDEYTCGCFCDAEGVVRGTIVMQREIQEGTTVRAVAGPFPRVRAEAERIAAALRPLGPLNIQMRDTPRGPVCFELNIRFSGTTPFRARLGFNEVDAALRHFVLREPLDDFPVIERGVVLRYWNEMYVDPAANVLLEQTGELSDPGAFDLRVEDYGWR